MIFMVAGTFGSSTMSYGDPLCGFVSVVIITIGKLLLVSMFCSAHTKGEQANTSKNKVIFFIEDTYFQGFNLA